MDERMEMEKNEKKRKITELAESYGYAYDDVKQVGSSAIFDWEIRKEKQADKGIPIGNHKQMADFIRFLRSCRGSKLKILGTITNPYAGQVKGTGVDFTLSDEHTLYYLELYMNTILYNIIVKMDIINTGLIGEIKNIIGKKEVFFSLIPTRSWIKSLLTRIMKMRNKMQSKEMARLGRSVGIGIQN